MQLRLLHWRLAPALAVLVASTAQAQQQRQLTY
jgi:hypothetical protein